MGAKHPDRIRPPPSPEQALTLAEMHLQRWTLRAGCGKCSADLRADLPTLIKVFGPDAIWWGKRPKCPTWDCTGHLTYSARSINGGTWQSLADPAPERLVAIWKAKNEFADRGPR